MTTKSKTETLYESLDSHLDELNLGVPFSAEALDLIEQAGWDAPTVKQQASRRMMIVGHQRVIAETKFSSPKALNGLEATVLKRIADLKKAETELARLRTKIEKAEVANDQVERAKAAIVHRDFWRDDQKKAFLLHCDAVDNRFFVELKSAEDEVKSVRNDSTAIQNKVRAAAAAIRLKINSEKAAFADKIAGQYV